MAGKDANIHVRASERDKAILRAYGITDLSSLPSAQNCPCWGVSTDSNIINLTLHTIAASASPATAGKATAPEPP